MSEALRQLCGRGSLVESCTHNRNTSKAEMALSALFDQFHELELTMLMFLWGWIGANDGLALNDCLSISRDIKGPNAVYQRTIERLFGTSERLKKWVQFVISSLVPRSRFGSTVVAQPLLDVVMVRHNAAHRSAQTRVFNHGCPRPTTFKWFSYRSPLDAPAELLDTCWRPSVPDFYRYSLSQNCVDVCLMGLQRREEIDAAIAGLQRGKLTPAELDYLNLYGDLHRNKLKIQTSHLNNCFTDRWKHQPNKLFSGRTE